MWEYVNLWKPQHVFGYSETGINFCINFVSWGLSFERGIIHIAGVGYTIVHYRLTSCWSHFILTFNQVTYNEGFLDQVIILYFVFVKFICRSLRLFFCFKLNAVRLIDCDYVIQGWLIKKKKENTKYKDKRENI